ncbi:hypothetical protein [Paenibacillus tundrae]
MFAYTRTLAYEQVLVLVNLCQQHVELSVDEKENNFSEIWLTNYEDCNHSKILRPFETRVGRKNLYR